jgi:1-deoxy-D-xylulose-5-phosphate synthase
VGKAEVLREGDDVLLIGIGSTVHPALEAADQLHQQGIEATVVNARFVKPLDEELILRLAKKIGRVMTIEENALQGGFGSAVMEMFQEASFLPRRFKRLGLPDEFVIHGSQATLRDLLGIDAQGIERAALELCEQRHGQTIYAIR